tara:strand:- start:139 stop:408 length:270 start_codon:yes stop_codon:yes gene_type:complete
MANDLEEIRKFVDDKKITIGANKTLKNLRLGKVKKIYLSSNCSPDLTQDIQEHSKINKVTISKLAIPNDELGTVCKKTFAISVLSVNNE